MFNTIRSRLYKAAYNPLANATKTKEPLETKPETPTKGPVIPEAADLPRDPAKEFLNSFIKTFLGLLIPALIFFICTLAGSIAANDAIGRHWAVRIVYFFYGSFPLFSPFVMIYYIYRYFVDTYPVWYNFLPLTTTVYDNSFMRLITKPLYYSDDANIQYMHKKFVESAKEFIMEAGSNGNAKAKEAPNGASANDTKGSRQNNNSGNVASQNSTPSNSSGSNGTTGSSANRGLNNKGATGSTGTNTNSSGPTGIGSSSLPEPEKGPTGV